jgi:flavin reductase (DIM6/NTAB) family NADH-FMN oxidoreductase RutF
MSAVLSHTWPGTGARPVADRVDCLAFYRRLAAGVTVVTSTGPGGPTGLTASAVTSVSLEPPLLLCCLTVGSRTLAAIRHSRGFAVHLLADHQAELARGFATYQPQEQVKFAEVPVRAVHGVPVLEQSLAWSVCRLESVHHAGDHVVVLGAVLAAGQSAGRPLIWHDGEFHRLAQPRGAASEHA